MVITIPTPDIHRYLTPPRGFNSCCQWGDHFSSCRALSGGGQLAEVIPQKLFIHTKAKHAKKKSKCDAFLQSGNGQDAFFCHRELVHLNDLGGRGTDLPRSACHPTLDDRVK